MFVWLNRAMIVLCQGFCYMKDISIYKVIQIINTFVDKIGSPQESIPFWKFSSPIPFDISDPLDSKPQEYFSFWNLASKAIFSKPLLTLQGGMHSMQDWGLIQTGRVIEPWVLNDSFINNSFRRKVWLFLRYNIFWTPHELQKS